MLYILLGVKPEVIVSIFGVIVALASAGVTLIFGLSQRKHNRNSVRPLPTIVFGDYEDDIYVELKNVGEGPLIIKKLRFYKEGIEADNLISLLTDTRNYIENYNLNNPQKEQYWTTYTDENIDGTPLGIKDSEFFIRIEPENDEIRERIRLNLSKISMKLEYQDVYNKTYEDKQRSFKYFNERKK